MLCSCARAFMCVCVRARSLCLSAPAVAADCCRPLERVDRPNSLINSRANVASYSLLARLHCDGDGDGGGSLASGLYCVCSCVLLRARASCAARPTELLIRERRICLQNACMHPAAYLLLPIGLIDSVGAKKRRARVRACRFIGAN